MMAKLAAWWIVVKKYWGYFQAGRAAGAIARQQLEARFPGERIVHVPPALPALLPEPLRYENPLNIGIDWAKGCDITSYSCSSCGFETGIVEDIIKHMKAHGATRLTVIPVRRPPAYRDDFRRG